jgi:hypothetical protein
MSVAFYKSLIRLARRATDGHTPPLQPQTSGSLPIKQQSKGIRVRPETVSRRVDNASLRYGCAPLHQTLELPVPRSAIALVFLSTKQRATGMSHLRRIFGSSIFLTGQD